MANKSYLVIGGTGYIGQTLVKDLLKGSYKLTLLIRNRKSLKRVPKGCEYQFGNLLNKDSLVRSLKGQDAVINLAAVVHSLNKKKYSENITGIKNLITAMQQANCKKLIHFSTQNVNLKNKGAYSRSKEIAEKIIISSDLEYLILRPNYVYGIDRLNYFFRFASMISKSQIALVIGTGNAKIQPLLKDELSRSIVDIIKKTNCKKIIELSGKDTLSMNEIISIISAELKTKPLIIHIPIPLLKIFESFLPFDINGFVEDRVSEMPYKIASPSSFRDNIRTITSLL